MKIFVRAKPNSKHPKVTKLSENIYSVAVSEPPVDGKANHAVVAALAEHFNVARGQVRLIAGATGKQKLFEIRLPD